MKTISVITLLVLLMTLSLIPASAQVYLPLVTNGQGQQHAAQPDKVAGILAVLEAEGVDPTTIAAVRAELQTAPEATVIQSSTVQITDSETIYTGCLLPASVIINVAVGEQPQRPCSKQAEQISWNQRGPQGEVGPMGPTGPQGEPGPQGAPGVIGFYYKWADFSMLAGVGERAGGMVLCDAGDQATGGGYSNPNAWAKVAQNMPTGGQGIVPTGWQVGMVNTTAYDYSIRVWAICADLTP